MCLGTSRARRRNPSGTAGGVAHEFTDSPDCVEQEDQRQAEEELAARSPACVGDPSIAQGQQEREHKAERGVDRSFRQRSTEDASPRERAAPDVALTERVAEAEARSGLPHFGLRRQPDLVSSVDQRAMHDRLAVVALPGTVYGVKHLAAIGHVAVADVVGRPFRDRILVPAEIAEIDRPVQEPVDSAVDRAAEGRDRGVLLELLDQRLGPAWGGNGVILSRAT